MGFDKLVRQVNEARPGDGRRALENTTAIPRYYNGSHGERLLY
jgi:hypothetical protein